MAYAARFTLPFASRDGFSYKFDIELRGYVGAVEELTAARDGVRISWGQGEAAYHETFFPSRAEISIVDTYRGILAEVQSADPTKYRGTLYRSVSSVWTRVWRGYLVPGLYRDEPWRQNGGVSLTFVDGFPLLDRLKHNETSTTTFACLLDAILGMDDTPTLYTCMNWAPWMPSPVASATDLLQALRVSSTAFKDSAHPDVLATRRHVLDSVIERFGLRMFQSAGAWWAVQRGELVGGTPTVWRYTVANSLVTPTAGYPKAENLVVSIPEQVKGYPRRELTPKVRSVTSTYDYSPELSDAVVNSNFEGVTGSPPALLNWTLEAEAELQENSGYDVTQDDRYSLYIWGAANASGQAVKASQTGQVLIPGNPAYHIKLQYRVLHERSSAPGKIIVKIGDWYLAERTLTLAQDAVKGREAVVKVNAIGGAYSATVGTPTIPKDTVLKFNNGSTLKLSDDVLAGNVLIKGDLDADVGTGHTAKYWVWQAAESQIVTGQVLDESTLTAFLATETGASVAGYVYVGLVQNVYSDPVLFGGSYWSYISMPVYLGDQIATGITWRAAMAAEAFGEEIVLPDAVLGDGPDVRSDTRLRCEDGAGVIRDTIYDAKTGWKRGRYSSGEATTGLSIDQLITRETLLLGEAGLERYTYTALLRGGATLGMHNVHRLGTAAYLRYAAPIGQTYIVSRTLIRKGRTVTIGTGATAETRTITDVTGSGPFLMWFSTALANRHEADEIVTYSVDLAPDALTWKVASGEAEVTGTELYRSDSTDYVIEQLAETV